MTDGGNDNAAAWGLPGVLDFFSRHRTTSEDVYPSEWLFLKDRLRDGMSVLDVGCAQGGFASVLDEHLGDFSYTGLDINSEMIALARERISGSTSSASTPNTSAAVRAWTSAPSRKAEISAGSCERWATTRSSTCE